MCNILNEEEQNNQELLTQQNGNDVQVMNFKNVPIATPSNITTISGQNFEKDYFSNPCSELINFRNDLFEINRFSQCNVKPDKFTIPQSIEFPRKSEDIAQVANQQNFEFTQNDYQEFHEVIDTQQNSSTSIMPQNLNYIINPQQQLFQIPNDNNKYKYFDQENTNLNGQNLLDFPNECLPSISQIKNKLHKVMKELNFKKIEQQFMVLECYQNEISNSLKRAGRSLVHSLQIFFNEYYTQYKFSKFSQIQVYLKQNRKQIKELFENDNCYQRIDNLMLRIQNQDFFKKNGLINSFDQLKQYIFGKHLNEIKQKYQVKDKFQNNKNDSLIQEKLIQCPYVRKEEMKIFYNFGYLTTMLIVCVSRNLQPNHETNLPVQINKVEQETYQYSTLDLLNNKINDIQNNHKDYYENIDFNETKQTFNQILNIDSSQKNINYTKPSVRSNSACSTNSQYQTYNENKIQDEIHQKFNQEIELPNLNISDIDCRQQNEFKPPNQYEDSSNIPQIQSQIQYQHDKMSEYDKQWIQIQQNYQCEERQISQNQQLAMQINYQENQNIIREEPCIKDDNREFGCVLFYDQNNQNHDDQPNQFINKQEHVKQYHPNCEKSIENISQQSSHSSYLQNPDKLTESVRNISQIVENTNNFMHILDLYTYDYISNGQHLCNTQNLVENHDQIYNSQDAKSSITEQNPNNFIQNDDYLVTIQTFTDDFVDEKTLPQNSNENRPQQVPLKSSKKTVGIRVDELLNKFKQESNFDTMSKNKSKKKNLRNNNDGSIFEVQQINYENNEIKDFQIQEFGSNQIPDSFNKIEDEPLYEIEVQSWAQGKFNFQESPQPIQLDLQNLQNNIQESQSFLQKDDSFDLQETDLKQNITFSQQTFNTLNQDLQKTNQIQIQVDNTAQQQTKNNSARTKRKYSSNNNKLTQIQIKNIQQKQKNEKYQQLKQQIPYQNILGQYFKKQANKQYESIRKQKNKIPKYPLNDIKKQKVENQKILNQNIEKNQHKIQNMIKQNIKIQEEQNMNNQNKEEIQFYENELQKQELDQRDQINKECEQKQIEENEEYLQNEEYAMLSEYQDSSQRNKIVSLLSQNSNKAEVFNLPLQLIPNFIPIEKPLGQSAQISSERKFIEEQKYFYQNLYNQFQPQQIQMNQFNQQYFQDNAIQSNVQAEILTDVNFQEMNFQNDQNAEIKQELSNRYEDRIKMLEDKNKELQQYINENKNMKEINKVNPIQIEVDNFDIRNDQKKYQDNLGTQPITATNVLLSSETNKQKFCFDYEEFNKQGDQQNEESNFQQQLNFLSSQRLSYEIGCFEGSSSNLNTLNFRTPRVIQMLSERSAEGYLPDFVNEGLFSNMINDQSPLQIDYSNSSYQQNTFNIENLNKNSKNNQDSKIKDYSSSSNISKKEKGKKKVEKTVYIDKNKNQIERQRKQKSTITQKFQFNQKQNENNQSNINIQHNSKLYKDNSQQMINKEDCRIKNQQINNSNGSQQVIQKQFSKVNIQNMDESQKSQKSSQKSMDNVFQNIDEDIQQSLNQIQSKIKENDISFESVEINRILENIETLKRARANSGDRRSSQELKILTDQVIEKSLQQIQKIQAVEEKKI